VNTRPYPARILAGERGGNSAARADAAYDYIKSQLLEGDYGPGQKLSVVDLTRELQCSRVPVMEALKRLASAGFVHIVPQVGCRVVTPQPAEVRDFFALFAAAEGTVTAFAAARRTAAEVEEFKQLCGHVDEVARSAGKPGDRDPTYRRLNLLFHAFVHRLARSPVTTAIAATMWDRSDFYIKLAFGSLYFSRAVREAHQAIRAAIIAGDAEAARGTGSAFECSGRRRGGGDGEAGAIARELFSLRALPVGPTSVGPTKNQTSTRSVRRPLLSCRPSSITKWIHHGQQAIGFRTDPAAERLRQ
jgi:DNA-binding GntR family transcriptional regulator